MWKPAMFAFTITLLLCGACHFKSHSPRMESPRQAVLHFLESIQTRDWVQVKRMISTVDLPEKERDAFLLQTRAIDLISFEIVFQETQDNGSELFKVHLLFQEDGTRATVEQEIKATRDYHRVWRVRI